MANNSYILAGEHDQRVIEGAEQVLDVSSVCFHEGFSMKHLRNDIALLTLGNPVALTDRVSTVCLPQREEQVPTGTKCYITGIPAQSTAYSELKQSSLHRMACGHVIFSHRVDQNYLRDV